MKKQCSLLDFLKSKYRETRKEEKYTDVDIAVEEIETEIAGSSSNKKSKQSNTMRKRTKLENVKTCYYIDVLNSSEMYPTLSKITGFGLILLLNTAACEHGFSQLKLIKTPHRNRLKQSTLDNLMMNGTEGPTIGQN